MSGVNVKGEKIEKLRLEKMVMDRKEFGEAVGLSDSAVWAIERKPQRAKPATLRRIAEVLGVKPQDLVRKKALK